MRISDLDEAGAYTNVYTIEIYITGRLLGTRRGDQVSALLDCVEATLKTNKLRGMKYNAEFTK